MIANVSPSHIATEHTLNTLRYADRVKELKKGMRCCPPPARNRGPVGNLSPKRIQSSPGIQAGEKSSPKKVKLGLHHHPTPARTKTSLFLCSPGHSPFSSTPKAQARKGHAGSSLLSQPSPVKGAGRAGPPAKKTVEDPKLPSEKGFFGKHFAPRTEACVLPRRENGQGDRQPGRGQKVQPVQKQLMARGDLSRGDTDHGEEAKAAISEQNVGSWASLPPHQKDREQHLRLYHQQFQQPPILHQKLDYQSLEKFLAQYKPQEIRVKQESPCEPPPAVSPQSQDETMQLEDLEDSDFSEDSFSPAPSRRKPEAGAAGGGSQGSFFLHQRECRPEDQEGCELIFKRHKLMPRSGAWLSTGEAACWEEAQMSLSDGSAEETAALKNDVPEKPYCSQGGDSVVCNTQNHLLGPKQPVLADLYRGSFCLPEKLPPSPPAVCLLASARCAGSDQKGESVKGKNALPFESKHLQAGEDRCEALAASVDFLAGAVTPSTASLLGTEILDVPKEDPSCQWQPKETVEKQSLSPVNQLYEDTIQFLGSEYEMDHFGRQTGQAKATSSSQPCLSPLTVGPDCIGGLSAGDAGLEGLSIYEQSALQLGDFQASECVAGHRGSTNPDALWKCGLGEEGGTRAGVQLSPAGILEKSLILDAASIFGGSENKPSSEENTPLQPSLEFRKLELGCVQEAFKFTLEEMGLLTNKWLPSALTLISTDAAKQDSRVAGRETNTRSPKASFTAYGQLDTSTVRKDTSGSLQCKEALERQFVLQIRQEQLDEMAALCLEEESLISQMLDVDLEGLVVKLDEMLMLKSRCIQRMRTQLQPFLATPNVTASQRHPPT